MCIFANRSGVTVIRMQRGHKKCRLFVAVYPPPAIVTWMAELVQSLSLPPHRLVPLEQVHLTVHFIGTVASKERPAISESVARSVAGLRPFELTTSSIRTLPANEKRPARVIAVETCASQVLKEIKSRLVRRSIRPLRRDPLGRFVPHLTMVRLAPPAVGFGIDHLIEQRSFEVSEVQLMQSDLKASGAVHRQLAVFQLAGS